MTATTSVSSTRWPRAFRYVYAASLTESVGFQVGYLAIPVLAVVALAATPGQVGLLAVLGTAAFLLIGLPAGVWVDRTPRRTVLVAAGGTRAVLYASVPLAWWADALTLGQLYAVVLLVGVATVFGDVAAQSVLPELIGRERLVAANSLLMTTNAVVQIGGRGLGGLLVQALGAPFALALNAVTHLLAALALSRIRPVTAPVGKRPAGGFGRELGEGVRHVLGGGVLRPLAVSLAGINLTVNLMTTMLPVVFLRELRLDAGALGLFLGVGGVGALLGAVTARPLAARIGAGRALWLPGLLVAPAGALVALVDHGPWLWLAGFGWLALAWRTGIGNVIGVSLRQRVTPDRLLGRMNATFRFLLTGAIAVGAGLAGLLGQYAGPRAPLWVGAAGAALTWLPLYLTRKRLPHGTD
ncbi:Predicted arabinose efflux permease, MFS family [Micromonospora sediminicola]|uniref:Predicted arabinose efflux permease, MFS family n=1 Tax=Micromonospora sediminicola TaxID=946078 RepID=A0A1A9BBA5_9ACTN|nr:MULTISPECIES: MFS transporter [Micromonospora]PGH44648.1 MFS transporter [Micromonospora sp. WMMA1996]SBT66438.1 Predicted arabinose efflux permease, MFS family [Micromonospora sediminicola]